MLSSFRYPRNANSLIGATLLAMLMLASSAGVFGFSDYLEPGYPGYEPFDSGSPEMSEPYELIDMLISFMTASRAEVIATFNKVVDQGLLVSSQAEEFFWKAELTSSEVYRLCDKLEYELAELKATKALELYGKALEFALKGEVHQVPEEPELTLTELAINVRESLDRAYTYSDQIYETLISLRDAGLDVSEAEDLMDDASALLQLADNLLEDGKVTEVLDAKFEALALMDDVMGILKELCAKMKAARALKFLEKSDEKLEKLEKMVENILVNILKTPETDGVVEGVFQEAKGRNSKMKTHLNESDVDDVIDDLDGVLGKIFEELEVVEELSEGSIEQLKCIGKLETKSDNIDKKLSNLRKKGVDTTPVEDTVNKTRGEFTKAVESLKSGDDEDINEKLETVEGLVEEIKETIKEMVKSSNSNNGRSSGASLGRTNKTEP